MPISKVHKEKKAKNYTILALLVVFMLLLVIITFVRFGN